MSRQLFAVAQAIAKGALPGAQLAKEVFATGASRGEANAWLIDEIRHYVYAGDTLLHVAAAAHQPRAVRALVDAGADPRARNRRGAEPLHYACDGGPGDQAGDVIALLVAAGADPNALDASGVAPLHRAVRCRVLSAVRALLDAGADPKLENKSGSSPLALAKSATGKSGAGSAAARHEQAEIVKLLTAR